jgi:hypothetical protein
MRKVGVLKREKEVIVVNNSLILMILIFGIISKKSWILKRVAISVNLIDEISVQREEGIKKETFLTESLKGVTLEGKEQMAGQRKT